MKYKNINSHEFFAVEVVEVKTLVLVVVLGIAVEVEILLVDKVFKVLVGVEMLDPVVLILVVDVETTADVLLLVKTEVKTELVPFVVEVLVVTVDVDVKVALVELEFQTLMLPSEPALAKSPLCSPTKA